MKKLFILTVLILLILSSCSYEYKTETVHERFVANTIVREGQLGWELVSQTFQQEADKSDPYDIDIFPYKKYPGYRLVFKRYKSIFGKP